MDNDIKEIEADLLRKHELFDQISKKNTEWETKIGEMEKEIVVL